MHQFPDLPNQWQKVLQQEVRQEWYNQLREKYVKEIENHLVYPPTDKLFEALRLTNFERVKVVILGQDPYHGAGQAHGLSFSVPQGVKPPPSLRNVFKLLENDFGKRRSQTDLTDWAEQGVLLLNSFLSVREKQPGSHQKMGWENLTDAIMLRLSQLKSNIVFMLWGKFAQQKRIFIDSEKHLILETTHPSPFSAHKGFLASQHFLSCNHYLEKHKKTPIIWCNANDLKQTMLNF